MTVLAVLLVVLAAAFAVYPLLRRSSRSSLPERTEERAAGRYALYHEIVDLEFDFATGKLSEADLKELRQACLAQAAELLRVSETDDEALEADLEEEIAAARAALAHAHRRAALPARAR